MTGAFETLCVEMSRTYRQSKTNAAQRQQVQQMSYADILTMSFDGLDSHYMLEEPMELLAIVLEEKAHDHDFIKCASVLLAHSFVNKMHLRTRIYKTLWHAAHGNTLLTPSDLHRIPSSFEKEHMLKSHERRNQQFFNAILGR